MPLPEFVYLVLGFFLLLQGSELFLSSVTRISKKLGVSEFIIGVTVTAIGTSIPELASSSLASLNNMTELVTGNVIGSNIANIGLIVGVCALIKPIKVRKRIYDRDGFILIMSILLFFFLGYDGMISRLDAALLAIMYVLYILFLINTRDNIIKKYKFHDFLEFFFEFQYMETVKSAFARKALEKRPKQRTLKDRRLITLYREGLIKDAVLLVFSTAALLIGAQYLIRGLVWLVISVGLQEGLLGLVLLGVGTSLPELIVGISAVRKKQAELIVGNIIGSNIANILLIVGVSSFISPLPISINLLKYSIPIMGFFSLAFIYTIKSNQAFGKVHGTIVLASYLLFIVISVLNNWV